MVSASIADGWAAFKRQPWLMIGAVVLVLLVSGAISGPSALLTEDGQPTSAYTLWSLLASLATFPLGVGMTYLFLRLVRGEAGVGIETLLAGYKRYVPLLGTSALMAVIIGIGLVLFVVPGIVASLGLMQAPMLVLDQGLSPVDAIKGSWAMMRGHKLDAFLLGLAFALLFFLGALALLVGLLVAIPVIDAASAAFYNRVLAANPPPQIGAGTVDTMPAA